MPLKVTSYIKNYLMAKLGVLTIILYRCSTVTSLIQDIIHLDGYMKGLLFLLKHGWTEEKEMLLVITMRCFLEREF